MAENKKKDRSSSIFKTTIIGSPIVIGGGIGLSRLSKDSSHFSDSISHITNHNAPDAIRQFTNRYANQAHSGTFKDWQLDKLAGFSDNITLTADQTRESIIKAARIADPTGASAALFSTRLGVASTGREVLKDLSMILTKSDSIYTQRAASIFIEDISALQTRINGGQSIDTHSIMEGAVPRKFPKITMADFDPRMRKDIFEMQQLLGADVNLKELSRADIPGSELQLQFKNSSKFKGDFTLRIPRVMSSNKALITRGTTQQSRYIAGTYGVLENNILKESFNHEQWTIRRALEDLVPKITRGKVLERREARRLAAEFSSQIMEAPEWIPSITPGEHAGIDEYINQRSQIMRLYSKGDNGMRALNEFEYYRLMSKGGADLPTGGQMPMFPGHSPAQIAKGVVSTQDVRGGLSLVPEAVPYGRRPLQFVRSGVSPLNPQFLSMNPTSNRFGWAKASMGVDTPMLRAAFVSSTLGDQFANTGLTAEGQMLISSHLSEQRAISQWEQFDIKSKQGIMDLDNFIDRESGGFWNINKKAQAGTFLGYGPNGRPVVLPQEMTLMHATAFENDAAKGDFIRVMAKKDIEQMRYSKVFGGAKGMAVETSPGYMENLLKTRVGVDWLEHSQASEIDALITMDELKKNRGLHYNQMFTSLWDFTKRNMESGKQIGTIASNFADDPVKIIARIRANALHADKFSHDIMVSEIMNIARSGILTPSQMGRVFGAVPDVFGDLSSLGPLSAAESLQINKGVATGTTQLWFEGLGGPGAGKTATIEPRMYELLDAPHFGAMGKELKAEVAQRMSAAYPERYLEQSELTEALQSVSKLSRRTGAADPSMLLNAAGEATLPNYSTSMKIAGMGDIYIPSSTSISQLSGFKTASGSTVEPALATAYRDIIGAANKYQTKDMTQEKMSVYLGKLENELSKARIATVTGKGGLLRGRLPGSVFLTAVQPTLVNKLPENVVGITSPMADKMFNEMDQLGLYQKAELEAMKKRFDSGGRISGTLGRHPYIGPYSTQAMEFQKIAGNQSVAMINERMQKAWIAGEAVGPIRLSPFVGLAGDVDGDIMSAMIAGPQLQQPLALQAQQNKMYEDYAIRSQVLKAKATGANVTLRKAMAGDAIKLGITQGGRLGKLSAQLQHYRGAILGSYGGLNDKQRMDALGLLEWMEQTPISGKHVAQGKELEMIHLLDDMQAGLRAKSANEIADATRTVMASAKMSGQKALRAGFDITMEDLTTGQTTQRFIPGIDISKSADNLMRATRAYEASAVGKTSAAQMRKLMMGKATPGTRDRAALMSEKALSQSPFGSFMKGGAQKSFAQFAEKAGTMLNKAGAAGRSMIPYAKPLALGTGIALGLAAVLSKPPTFMSPGSAVSSPANMQSGTGGANLGYGIHPHEQQIGQPTARNAVQSQHTARLAQQDSSGYRVNIQGSSRQNIDMASLNGQIRQALGGRARINSSIRDQRSSLTAQKLSSILHDG